MIGFDGYNMSPWMWGLGSLMMLLFWGGLILVVLRAIRARGGLSTDGFDNPRNILKRRLAAGEITQDEYERTHGVLEG
jgi:putative membrane protein